MKGTLEFDLSEPHEKKEMEAALNCWKFLSSLSEIDSICRDKIKYGDEVLSDDVVKLLETIRIICSVNEEYFY